jgi:hypothetical protein
MMFWQIGRNKGYVRRDREWEGKVKRRRYIEGRVNGAEAEKKAEEMNGNFNVQTEGRSKLNRKEQAERDDDEGRRWKKRKGKLNKEEKKMRQKLK